MNHSKVGISIMFCGNADGQMLEPYTVYKAKNMYPAEPGCRVALQMPAMVTLIRVGLKNAHSKTGFSRSRYPD